MLNHLVIWDYWLARIRSGRSASSTSYTGHTASEKEAFDRLMDANKTGA